MALTPFGFMLVGEPAFGPSSRELRKLNKAFEGWTSALMPAFDQLPVQAAATTAMDLVESDTAFTVRADAPGFDPEDVNISLKDGVITISGRKDNDKKQEQDGKVVRRERTSVSFTRSFVLPDNIKQDDISASLDKGVLTVTLPKEEPTAKPQPRRITVQPAAAAAAAPDAAAAVDAAGAPTEEGKAQQE